MTIFGPQGIRDAMTNSYRKHLRKLAGDSLPSGTSLHHASLYGALTTRNMVGSESQSEAEVWTELAPYLNLPSEEAVAALAEYVIYKEMPEKTDVENLRVQVRRGWSLLALDERESFGMLAEINGVLWLPLLNSAHS